MSALSGMQEQILPTAGIGIAYLVKKAYICKEKIRFDV